MFEEEKVRPLSVSEAHLWRASLINTCHMVVVCTLKTRLPLAALRTRLIARIKERPKLRWRIQRDEASGKAYFIDAPGFDPAVTIAEGLGAEDWQEYARYELNQNFKNGDSLIRLSLLASGHDLHLLMVVHHALTDGAGAIYLLRDLLAPRGSWQAPDPLPIEEHLKFRPGSILQNIGRMLPSFLTPAVKLPPAQLLPVKERGAACFFTRLTESQTSQLVDWSKRTGVSVHSSLNALLMFEIFHRMGPGKRHRVGCMSPYSLRHILPEENREGLGLFVSTLSHFHRLQPDTDLQQLAREVDASLARMRRQGLGEDVMAVQRAFGFTFVNDALAIKAIERFNRFTISISNLGLMPFPAGDLGVTNAFVVGSSAVFGGTSIGLSVITVNKRMNLTFKAASPLLNREILASCSANMVALIERL